jgi:nucleotide-binding universal stress UspA family protein
MRGQFPPPQIHTILVAVDGSGYSEKAGLWASDVAQKYSAKLFILHVAKYPTNNLGVTTADTVAVGFPLKDSMVDQQKKNAMALMDRLGSVADKLGLDVEKQVLDTSSSISASIADFAYRNNVDLIALGNRGLNEFQETIVGSVAAEVIQKAACTVMVVR